ncbi:methyltransferase [Methanosarcina mazei Tuc01]|uniref:Methyltransferase n=1 Tax=Methanosarcina mazei Tuc01 TaxID=1236903 RepID=M1P8J4_METMZ|nr:TRAM domain-containing protein [Methanosarcina mazei]AGF96782.1 methyltransferase [Methanosarcina mazei Tuc01]
MFREESGSVPVEEGEVYDVTIQDLARQGDGIARIEGFVIFVPGTKVGDEVRIKIERVLLQALSSKFGLRKHLVIPSFNLIKGMVFMFRLIIFQSFLLLISKSH